MKLDFQHITGYLGHTASMNAKTLYSEWDDGLGKSKIAMFLAVSTENREFKLDEPTQSMFRLLKELFLADLTGDPYARFENAIREINQVAAQKEQELGQKFIPEWSILCGVLDQDQLFLAQRGHSVAYLVRNRHTSVICEAGEEENTSRDLFQNIVCGNLELNDTVLLTTAPLLKQITPSDLALMFSDRSLQEAQSELSSLLGHEMEDSMALLGVEVLEMTGIPASRTGPSQVASEEVKSNKAIQGKAVQILDRSFRFIHDYADRQRREDPRKFLISIAVLSIILVGGVWWLFRDGNQEEVMAQLESDLEIAQAKISEAATQGSFDKEKAATLLSEAEALVMSVLASDYLHGAASDVLQDIQDQKDLLDKVTLVQEKELTVLASFSGDLVAGESMACLGWSGDRLVAFSVNKSFELLLEETRDPYDLVEGEFIVDASYFDDLDNVILLSKTGKIVSYDNGTAQLADTSDTVWKNATAIFAYTGKLYLLDSSGNQIWRYEMDGDRFGSAQSYLADSSTVNLSDAVSIAIDGNVWVLHSNGTISKFLSGETVPFEIEQAPLTSFAGSTVIYTDLNLSELFVLDSLNNRVLVFDKSTDPESENLIYKNQYEFGGLSGDLVDIYVSIDQDMLYLLTEKSLYEMPL